MNRIYALVFSVVLCTNLFISSAQNCTNNRYYDSIFPTVTEIKNLEYGRNYKQDGVTEEILKLDLYMPAGDVDTARPLIIYAHGGSFISGNRTNGASTCKNYAKMGYVAATMSYRLLTLDATVYANPGLEFQKELIRAVHDMRAAIRFFRKGVAEENNPYRINPNIIIVTGGSAGAILANHTAYMDAIEKAPAEVHSYIQEEGGLEGNTGNAGYSSVPQIVVSLCGAIGDTAMMEAGDQPYIGVHTYNDDVVPNLSGSPTVNGMAVPVTLYGDSLMYIRAQNIGLKSAYLGFASGGHCQFPATATANFVKTFLHERLCIDTLITPPIDDTTNVPSSISATSFDTPSFFLYPNPAEDYVMIDAAGIALQRNITIVNIFGQEVWKSPIAVGETNLTINTDMFEKGLYVVQLQAENGKKTVKKLVIK